MNDNKCLLNRKAIEYWGRRGFISAAKFPNEYELFVNLDTMQRLRHYDNGSELLSDPKTGQYLPVDRKG